MSQSERKTIFMDCLPSFDAKQSMISDNDVDDYMWFPEAAMHDPFGAERAPPAVSEQQEHFEDLIMIVESVDSDDESPRPGIFAENFNDIQSQQHMLDMQSSSSSIYSDSRPPSTPPSSTKPIFTELPALISPETDMDRDCVTPSPVDEAFEAFAPPRQNEKQSHNSKGSSSSSINTRKTTTKMPTLIHPQPRNPLINGRSEESSFEKLAASMRRSQASRGRILQNRKTFGDHHSFSELQRLDDAQRRMMAFLTTDHQSPEHQTCRHQLQPQHHKHPHSSHPQQSPPSTSAMSQSLAFQPPLPPLRDAKPRHQPLTPNPPPL